MNDLTQSAMSRKIGACRETFEVLSADGAGALLKGAARYRFPADFAGFDGHFPGDPLLPGVLMVAMALQTAAALLGRPVLLTGIRRAKYFRRVLPEMTVETAVTAEVAGDGVTLGVTVYFPGETSATVAKLQLKGVLS